VLALGSIRGKEEESKVTLKIN